MSVSHPIIAVTGSSGAGTSTVKHIFEHIFQRESINAVIIEGDSFHKYDRASMGRAIETSEKNGQRAMSHFGPEANLFEEQEALFRSYSERGNGQRRHYLHDEAEAAPWKQRPGTFTPWEPLPSSTDCLFYEGLHGGVVTDRVNVAQYVDLLIGVVPTVNLEWIQKIHRDTQTRGYSLEAVTHTILRRMHDYVHYIVPQFSRTHLNFQRVPMVDTSNPFVMREVPSMEESLVVIHWQRPERVNFPYLLAMIHDSWMSNAQTMVIPGTKTELAMQLILTPMVTSLIEKRRSK